MNGVEKVEESWMETSKTSRIYGLDTLRASAIVLVLMYHYAVFVSHKPTFGILSEVGWIGVDLFFMLSGYLIGNQIFAPISRGEPFQLKRFMFRRLMRTLPNYWVVLAGFVLFPALCGKAIMPPIWKFLTFTQNIDLQPGTAFSHAWSLCVEEQFYFILPVAALLIASTRRTAVVCWTLIGLLIAGGMALRWVRWHDVMQAGQFDARLYMSSIYYASVCRADELLMGVALAVARNFHPRLWAKATSYGWLTMLLGLVAASATAYWVNAHDGELAVVAFGYPLLGISFAVLTLSALSANSPLHWLRIPGAGAMATWSFAIYLVHKQFWILLAPYFREAGWLPTEWRTAAVLMVIAIVIGATLYYSVERYFLGLRDRLQPGASRVGGVAAQAR
jgi:peptidoglycan/LPS O-acetylase OafA/YrhL